MTRRARFLVVAVLACLPITVLTPSAQQPTPPAAEPAVRLAGGTAGPTPEPAHRPRLRTATIALSGDILVHDNVWASAQRLAARSGAGALDFRPMLASLRPALTSADLAICHLETPLAPPGGPYSGYPVFSAPPQVVAALAWAGYDACSTASNHSVDQGFAGITRTLDALDRHGLAHTGSARTPQEAARHVVLDVNGIRVAWLSYTYGTNGMPVDADKPWSVNLIDPRRIERDAHAARREGADAVLVALHWGDEYSHTPSAFQRDLADRLTRDPDITLVYGHHAHVVQPIERIHGTWVVFGLGNLLAGQGTTASGVDNGMVAFVTLRQRGDGPVRVATPTYRPTHIDYSDPRGEFRVWDDLAGLASPGLDPATRAELRASLAQTRGVVGRP
ncbi:MAG: CapA family protein [Nocardioidaceae bacterium]